MKFVDTSPPAPTGLVQSRKKVIKKGGAPPPWAVSQKRPPLGYGLSLSLSLSLSLLRLSFHFLRPARAVSALALGAGFFSALEVLAGFSAFSVFSFGKAFVEGADAGGRRDQFRMRWQVSAFDLSMSIDTQASASSP